MVWMSFNSDVYSVYYLKKKEKKIYGTRASYDVNAEVGLTNAGNTIITNAARKKESRVGFPTCEPEPIR